MTREELWAAMRRDAEGMRGLQRYLDEIKGFDDDAFAQATGGADRAESMKLLASLNGLLREVDNLTAQLHPDLD